MARRITRRDFLFGSAVSVAGIAVAACGQPAAAPSGTSGSASSSATSAPGGAARTTPTPVATVVSTAVPTMAPEARYSEAPELAELVAQGKLPPVEERLPENPLVLAPIDGIGKYGGTIRIFSRDVPASTAVMWQYGHSPVRYTDDGMTISPGYVYRWETNADNTEWTLYWRKGLRWSDGEYCTVDDVIFWYEDMVKNPDHSDQVDPILQAAGKLCEMTKIDDWTLKITYPAPAPLTIDRLAMWAKCGSGTRWIVPSHFMKQFHPKYNTQYKTFEEYDLKLQWWFGSGAPVLTHWMVEDYTPAGKRTMVRNPYYYAVDPEGNQLPYIGRTEDTAIEDAEVQKLTVMQGGVDYAWRATHRITLADLSTMLANEDKGNYKVYFRDSGDGTGRIFYWNLDNPDEKYRNLYRDKRFRQALSYGKDRATIQKVVYYNTGMLSTGTFSPKAIEFNFSEEAQDMFRKWRDSYVEYDLDRARALLDEIGMKDVDGDGYREFPDGAEFELNVALSTTPNPDGLKIMEMNTATWADIGIKVVLNQMPGAELGTFMRSGQWHTRADWECGDGPNFWVYPSWVVPDEPTRWSPLAGNLLRWEGTEKENQEMDVDPWQRNPPRFNASEISLMDPNVVKLQEIYRKALLEVDPITRHHYAWEMTQIHIDDGPYMMGCVGNVTTLEFVSKNLMNVPTHRQLKTGGYTMPSILPHPAVWNTETYSYTDTPIDKDYRMR